MLILPGIVADIQLLQYLKGGVLELLLDVLLLLLVLDLHARVYFKIQLTIPHACELFIPNVNEQLRDLCVCHDLFYREYRGDVALDEDFKEVLDVGVLGHLQHDVLAELESVVQNVRQFGVHKLVEVPVAVFC